MSGLTSHIFTTRILVKLRQIFTAFAVINISLSNQKLNSKKLSGSSFVLIFFGYWKIEKLTKTCSTRSKRRDHHICDSHEAINRRDSLSRDLPSLWSIIQSQSTASHLFARARSFHRPTFICPALNIVMARLAERVWCTKFKCSLPNQILTSASVGSSPRSYLFTSAMVRIPVHTAPKYGTKPIRYVTLHFQDRRGPAWLRRSNRPFYRYDGHIESRSIMGCPRRHEHDPMYSHQYLSALFGTIFL